VVYVAFSILILDNRYFKQIFIDIGQEEVGYYVDMNNYYASYYQTWKPDRRFR